MIDGHTFLRERLAERAQVPSTESISGLPPYLDAFLSHLRLLVGVPFQSLVPHEELLPDGAIRFFYVDRSWTDRLVDGAAAVGKLGSREVAHYEAHVTALAQSIDAGERLVRAAQRRLVDDWGAAKTEVAADTVTGFLLRSGLVSGWPHLAVRAYRGGAPLELARLERLSPGVLIALFFGVPDRVELEEPHHGVQFGVTTSDGGSVVHLRSPVGERVHDAGGALVPVPVPMRSGGRGVVHVRALRAAIDHTQRTTAPTAMPQTGSAALALTVLDPPFLQPFAGDAKDEGGRKQPITIRVADLRLEQRLDAWVNHV